MESDIGWVISWPVSHKLCLSANHFSECLSYLNIFEYSNIKLNEYAIFEYCKNLYSLDALLLCLLCLLNAPNSLGALVNNRPFRSVLTNTLPLVVDTIKEQTGLGTDWSMRISQLVTFTSCEETDLLSMISVVRGCSVLPLHCGSS